MAVLESPVNSHGSPVWSGLGLVSLDVQSVVMVLCPHVCSAQSTWKAVSFRSFDLQPHPVEAEPMLSGS